MPAHNEALVGDELTTLILNHEWRRIVSSALLYYWTHGRTELAYENEDALDDLLIDLYNSELLGMKITLYQNMLPANRTRSGAAYATVLGSERNHQFTKSKAKITLKNIYASISANAEVGYFRIVASTGSILGTVVEVGVGRTDIVVIDAIIQYQNLDLVNPTQIRLEFGASGGQTVTCYAEWNMIWVIEEYD